MQENNKISNGVMLNVYPDSIGTKFSDTVAMLKRTEFKNAFSLKNSSNKKLKNKKKTNTEVCENKILIASI